jgi:hypothetical protein
MVRGSGVHNKERSPYAAVVHGCWDGMAGGLFRRAKTFLGRQMVHTPWGSHCGMAGVEMDDWQEGSGTE